MSHRVIAGKARGRKLKMVPGNSTRPIMDKVKEALFSILGDVIPGSTFLDLFAGTGAVGIEAISRGAQFVRFIDNDKAAIRTIYENLAQTQLAENAEVLHTNAFGYLKRSNPTQFEIVYIAPPQYKDMWKTALTELDTHPANMYPDAMVIVQIDPNEVEELSLKNLHLYREKTYGNTLLQFYEYLAEEDDVALEDFEE
jgi:16S rRNA (guanine(966)-N(2))-methyltransferase RsmD